MRVWCGAGWVAGGMVGGWRGVVWRGAGGGEGVACGVRFNSMGRACTYPVAILAQRRCAVERPIQCAKR